MEVFDAFAVALCKSALKKYVYSQGFLLFVLRCSLLKLKAYDFLRSLKSEPFGKKNASKNSYLHHFIAVIAGNVFSINIILLGNIFEDSLSYHMKSLLLLILILRIIVAKT